MSGIYDPIVYTITKFVGSSDEINFNEDVPDLFGISYYLQEPPGWAGPDVRRTEIPLALRDGTRRASGYYGSRDMTLNGTLVSKDRDVTRAAYAQLLEICDTPRFNAVIFIASEDVGKVVTCQISGTPLRKWHGPVMEFSIPMVASDPLKYELFSTSETLVPGTAETLVNTGDKDTYPYLVISANGGTTITDVEVQNLTSGKTARFVTSIPSGQKLFADMRDLYLGNADARVGVGMTDDGSAANRTSSWQAPRETLFLEPGNNSIKLVVNAGANAAHRLDVTWRGAWL